MSHKKDGAAAIVSRIKELLTTAANDLQKKIKLRDYLTASLPYDYHYMSAVFSKATNTTIEKHFIALKVKRIKHLLRDGVLSISEISFRCGYSSPAHLTTQFKKATGQTPGQFRRESSLNNRGG